MLKETKRIRVFGTDILMLGTYHKTVTDTENFDPTKTDLYRELSGFSPDVLAVELTESQIATFKNAAMTHPASEVKSLMKYFRTHPVRVLGYDEELQRSMAEYSTNMTKQQDRKLNSADGPAEVREVMSDVYPELYEDLFENRETHGMSNIMSLLGKTDRLAFHCGNGHYESYERYFEFLKASLPS